MASVVQDLEVDSGRVRVAVQTFADSEQPRFELNTFASRSDVIDAVREIPYSRGTTNTAAALRYARETMFTAGNGDREGVPNIAVVLTDGGSNDKAQTMQEAYLTKQAGVHIITIGVGGWTDEYELIRLASYPYATNKIDVRRFSALLDVKDRIRNLVCNSE